MGEGGVKNPEKLPTSFMDGPKMKLVGVVRPYLKYLSIFFNMGADE